MEDEDTMLKYEGYGFESAKEVSRAFIQKHEDFYPKNATILDCGAGNGIFSLLAVTQAGASRAFSYEGYYAKFHQLLENVRNNSLYSVLPDDHHILGSTGREFLNVDSGLVNRAGIGEKFLIETRRIDDLVLPELDLMKITVPGAAMEIIHGAVERIQKDLPSIIVEVISDSERRKVQMLLDNQEMVLDSSAEFSRLKGFDGKLLFFKPS